MEKFKQLLLLIRALLMKTMFPASKYWLATRSLNPISTKFGYDRGKPIDRFWIEDFLNKNKHFIKGNVLEVTDNTYTKKFGGDNVLKSDVLDIDTKNNKATIYGDLRNLQKQIPDNTYDCILMTHVLGLIDDIDSAIKECHRILKPNGMILATSACISPTYDLKNNFWRFTENGARYLFTKSFKDKNIEINSYGNALTGQCFWVGMAQEDLTVEELEYNDPKFPCVITIKAKKESNE